MAKGKTKSKGRTFGIEIECGSPWRNRPRTYNAWSGYCRSCQEYTSTCDHATERPENSITRTRNLLIEAGLPAWAEDVGFDGTELEIRSPILQGTEGFRELRRAFKLLNDEGFYTTRADGSHIHIGAEDFMGNKELIEKLAESWTNNQDNIFQLVHPIRRNRGACPAWSDAKVERLKQTGRVSGRDALNLCNVTQNNRNQPTVEFRLHEGTLDIDAIESWIRFGMKLMDGVLTRKRPIAKCNDADALVKRLRVGLTHKKALRPWREKEIAT